MPERNLTDYLEALEDVAGVSSAQMSTESGVSYEHESTLTVQLTFIKGGNWRLACDILEDLMEDHEMTLADVEQVSTAKKTLTLYPEDWYRGLFPREEGDNGA